MKHRLTLRGFALSMALALALIGFGGSFLSVRAFAESTGGKSNLEAA